MKHLFTNLQNRLYGILRWSERYTKTDMVYLAKGGFWMVLSQIITSTSILAVAIAFANLVSPTTYGTYKYILSLAGIFSLFSLPGLEVAVARATTRGEEGVIPKATRARVRYALAGSFVTFCGGVYYLLNANIELAFALFIISATLPFFDTFTLYLARAIGKRRFDTHTGYRAVEYIASALTIITTLFFTDTLAYILLAYFLPLIAVRFFFYIREVSEIPSQNSPSVFADVLRYGKHLTVIKVLGMVAMNIDKILLWKLLGPGAVAVYTFSIAIPDQMQGPIKGISELAFAKFSGQNAEEVSKNISKLWRKLALYALALLGVAFVYALIAPFIYQLLFPQYMESVLYSQIVALSLLGGVGTLAYRLFEAQKKTKAQYSISIAQHLIQIALFLIFIPLYGILGAVIALVLGRLFMTIQTLIVIRRIF